MSAIKPAMTPTQWEERCWYRQCKRTHNGGLFSFDADEVEINGDDHDEPARIFDEERHVVAAACLYAQPYGFTWADVDALQYDGVGYDEGHSQEALDSLAERIAALLPPRDAK